MFTGLVEELGIVREVLHRANDRRLTITGPTIANDVQIGASIAVSGCCLTVVHVDRDACNLTFEAGEETLRCTTLGSLSEGDGVNLERSLKLNDRLGGHFVTGHVDGIGTLMERTDDERWSFMRFSCHEPLSRMMASKGSVAVDGVSLTLVDVGDGQFTVALIPHTLSVTTLGRLSVGASVNIEADILAKYVARQLATTDRHELPA